MNQIPTKPYSIRLDADVRQALEAEAAREDRPAAQLASLAIKNMLAAKAAKRSAIEAALAEADAGEFVSLQSATDWVTSWDADTELSIPEVDHKPS